jgi:hypothetical protein
MRRAVVASVSRHSAVVAYDLPAAQGVTSDTT